MTSPLDSQEVCLGLLVPRVLIRPSQREVPHLRALKPLPQEGEIIWIWGFESRYGDKLGKATIYFKDEYV